MRNGGLAIFLLITVCVLSVLPGTEAQSGAVNPQGGVGHAKDASCVILKRMGPADEVTSHLYSFGIRGKQFQFVEGKLPEGFPFHGRLTDHDVRNLQGRGAEVLILEPHYTAEDLKQAREQCEGMTGKTPEQTPDAAKGHPDQSANATKQDGGPSPGPTTSQANVTVSSIPSGADIEIDGAFVGSTPSTLKVTPGTHEIKVKKSGFADWTRKLNVSGGDVNLDATLEAAPPPSPAANSAH